MLQAVPRKGRKWTHREWNERSEAWRKAAMLRLQGTKTGRQESWVRGRAVEELVSDRFEKPVVWDNWREESGEARTKPTTFGNRLFQEALPPLELQALQKRQWDQGLQRLGSHWNQGERPQRWAGQARFAAAAARFDSEGPAHLPDPAMEARVLAEQEMQLQQRKAALAALKKRRHEIPHLSAPRLARSRGQSPAYVSRKKQAQTSTHAGISPTPWVLGFLFTCLVFATYLWSFLSAEKGYHMAMFLKLTLMEVALITLLSPIVTMLVGDAPKTIDDDETADRKRAISLKKGAPTSSRLPLIKLLGL